MKTREELGYCGCDCEECNIYRSMLYREELKPEIVKRWQEDAKKYWGIESLDPKQLNCKGCRNESGDTFIGWKLCPVKNCCKKRGLSSCGICPEFQTCEWLEPDGRKNFEEIAGAEK